MSIANLNLPHCLTLFQMVLWAILTEIKGNADSLSLMHSNSERNPKFAAASLLLDFDLLKFYMN